MSARHQEPATLQGAFRHVAASIREPSAEIHSLWGVLHPARAAARKAHLRKVPLTGIEHVRVAAHLASETPRRLPGEELRVIERDRWLTRLKPRHAVIVAHVQPRRLSRSARATH